MECGSSPTCRYSNGTRAGTLGCPAWRPYTGGRNGSKHCTGKQGRYSKLRRRTRARLVDVRAVPGFMEVRCRTLPPCAGVVHRCTRHFTHRRWRSAAVAAGLSQSRLGAISGGRCGSPHTIAASIRSTRPNCQCLARRSSCSAAYAILTGMFGKKSKPARGRALRSSARPALAGYCLDFKRGAALRPMAFRRAVSCLLCNSRTVSRSALSGRARARQTFVKAITSHVVHVQPRSHPP